MDFAETVGLFMRDGVLGLASLLVFEAVPGLVVAIFLLGLVGLSGWYWHLTRQRANALEALGHLIQSKADPEDLHRLHEYLRLEPGGKGSSSDKVAEKVAEAWGEYAETFVVTGNDDERRIQNCVRPSVFFNMEDLGFGPGGWRVVPGMFVSVGLALTFLGLISALSSMDLSNGDSTAALNDLLTIASAKFIMSLTGLFCSIVFTIILRRRSGKVETALHHVCRAAERRLSFISLEDMASRQLKALDEQRNLSQRLCTEIIEQLGKPLREDLPNTIGNSISAAMAPLLQQVGRAGADGMDDMVRSLSSRFSDDVGKALSIASERLMDAADRITQLSARMDQSSNRMGGEMEVVVGRMAQAVDDLRGAMTASARETAGSFADGAERMLAAMNNSLQAIRDNTAAGAEAMTAAAAEMKGAAGRFREELDVAARSGSTAVAGRMQEAGAAAGNAIDAAGRGVLEAFTRTAAELQKIGQDMSGAVGRDLMSPLVDLTTQMRQLVDATGENVTGMRRLSDGVRAGADAAAGAAGSFDTAARQLVAAADPVRGTVERLEVSARMLNEATGRAVETVTRSAEQTARSAAESLSAARDILGGERQAVEASLEAVTAMLGQLRGQGDRLDDMDDKLGRAFQLYASEVESVLRSMEERVRDIHGPLQVALDTLREVVGQIDEFRPESQRRI